MAFVPETNTFPAGVYQLETSDKAVGGVSGISNQQAKDLASRTLYLKNRTDAIYNKVDFYYANATPIVLGTGGNVFIDNSTYALTYPLASPDFTTPNDGITRTYKITISAFADFTYGASANVQMILMTTTTGPTFVRLMGVNLRQPYQGILWTKTVTLLPNTPVKAFFTNNATGANATFSDISLAIEEVL